MFSKRVLLLAIILAAMGPIVTASAYDSDGDGVDDHLDVCCATPEGTPVDEHGRPIGDLDGDCDVDLLDYGLLQAAVTGQLSPCPPCDASDDCAADHYCAKLLGDCQAEGACSLSPLECPPAWDTVCGCDGVTYASACFAALGGTSVDHEGVCQPPGCLSNADCGPFDFCAKAYGYCDETGYCQPRPTTCMPVYERVCGCDTVTYFNSCDAAMAGASVDHEGPCLPPTCQETEECQGVGYCAKTDGDCDGTGRCQPPPSICVPVWDPVCTCDLRTYENSCYAARAGESVDYIGECQPPPCATNDDCEAVAFCDKAVGVCDDGAGQCQPRPGGCIPSGEPPVCGCDGVTYADSCFARLAGVSIAQEGSCP